MNEWRSKQTIVMWRINKNVGLCILTKCIVHSAVVWMANQDVWAWMNAICHCIVCLWSERLTLNSRSGLSLHIGAQSYAILMLLCIVISHILCRKRDTQLWVRECLCHHHLLFVYIYSEWEDDDNVCTYSSWNIYTSFQTLIEQV